MLRSSSELLGSAPTSELQALLSPYKSAACWRESPLLRSFEVKNSELWLQMGPASAVCGELGLPSLERAARALSDVLCDYCGKKEHKAEQCWQKKRNERAARGGFGKSKGRATTRRKKKDVATRRQKVLAHSVVLRRAKTTKEKARRAKRRAKTSGRKP